MNTDNTKKVLSVFICVHLWPISLSSLLREAPTFTEGRPQILIRLDVIGDPHLHGIVFDLAFHTQSDHAEQHPLDERGGVVEVRARRVAALAGADPIAVVRVRAAGRARQQRGGEAVVAHLLYGDEARLLAVGSCGDHTLAADEEAAI